ncbi:aspartic peptidase domain-containing protein [Flammula alnicola]|nr:aspartic peptidase domain-containing protein [Flammula alnicola]
MRYYLIWLSLLELLPATVQLATALTTTSTTTLPAREPTLEEIARRYTKRTAGGVHLPIVSRETPWLVRRGTAAGIGLGDYVDVAYTVLITVGGITTPLILDTGSSDLWIMSDACTRGCAGDVTLYPQSSFRYAGQDVKLLYGDSKSGTFASGIIGGDTVDLAGLALQNQYFAAINKTNTSVAEVGAAGIFGLGFPVNSVIWNTMFSEKYHLNQNVLRKRRDTDTTTERETPMEHPKLKLGSPFPNAHFLRRSRFPSLPGLLGAPSRHTARQTSSVLYSAFASYATLGPFLPRLVATGGALSQPMFSVTLQRDTVDVGGSVGMLSIGELPAGVDVENMTWVPLRLYTYDEGGFPAPPDAPNEVYPITWEVMLDGVYFDGKKLPNSTSSSSSIALSALIDTGNSLIRGPSDIVAYIQSQLGRVFPCSEPHTLAFQIGGKMFPVDPRDFVSQAYVNNAEACTPNLIATDPPEVGGYQFSWSLGTPFLKGVLSSYYYGNLTYPSVDPPKMGFLSTVPTDAAQQMKNAANAAAKADENFPAVSEPAPSGTIRPLLTNVTGIPQPTSQTAVKNGALRMNQFELSGARCTLVLVFLLAWLAPFLPL